MFIWLKKKEKRLFLVVKFVMFIYVKMGVILFIIMDNKYFKLWSYVIN